MKREPTLNTWESLCTYAITRARDPERMTLQELDAMVPPAPPAGELDSEIEASLAAFAKAQELLPIEAVAAKLRVAADSLGPRERTHVDREDLVGVLSSSPALAPYRAGYARRLSVQLAFDVYEDCRLIEKESTAPSIPSPVTREPEAEWQRGKIVGLLLGNALVEIETDVDGRERISSRHMALNLEREYEHLMNGLNAPWVELGSTTGAGTAASGETKIKAPQVLRVDPRHATQDNLIDMLRLGHSVLHISCHSGGNVLFFEDKYGAAHPYALGDVAWCLKAYPYPPDGLQLVVLMACSSEDFGNVFLSAGARYVIAIARNKAVSDEAAIEFTGKFYGDLARGLDMSTCFLNAQEAVAMHAYLLDAAKEAAKFKLMSCATGFTTPIFAQMRVRSSDVEKMRPREKRYKPLWPLKQRNVTKSFTGRQDVIYKTSKVLASSQHECVYLYGIPKVGKTQAAMAVAKYMAQKHSFGTNTLFLSAKDTSWVARAQQWLLNTSRDRTRRLIVFDDLGESQAAKRHLNHLKAMLPANNSVLVLAVIDDRIREPDPCYVNVPLLDMKDAADLFIRCASLIPDADAMTLSEKYAEYVAAPSAVSLKSLLAAHPLLKATHGFPDMVGQTAQSVRQNSNQSPDAVWQSLHMESPKLSTSTTQ